MAGMKGITANTAPEAEPHIYAEDDAAVYQAIFGGDGVFTIGQACKATVLSNNKVRVADGVVCVGGHMARIPYGEYEDCDIMNGQSRKNRNDIIVAKFETTGTGGIDTMTCEVIQGTAGETAVDPELTQDDIYAGGKVREYPLYRVKIEGLSITDVERMFETIPSNKDLSDKVAELNKNIPRFCSKTTSLTYSNAKCMKGKAYVGEQFSGCFPQLTLLAKTQQPYTQTNAVISDQVDSQGNVNILAYGSGYVNGHVLTVAVFVCK